MKNNKGFSKIQVLFDLLVVIVVLEITNYMTGKK